MITLEYILAQHQEGDESVAIKSRKTRQENPALFITRENTDVVWQLRGLVIGNNEDVEGEGRISRIDFYIGMEDLTEQRGNFPPSLGVPMGNPDGLRNPVGTERAGGTQIRWKRAVGRVPVSDVAAVIPPYRFSRNPDSELRLNIDSETSPYPIVSDGGARTTKELHFGIEHDYQVQRRGNLAIGRIEFRMTEDQYATVLAHIDDAIDRYEAL